jgi:hypothetical protein
VGAAVFKYTGALDPLHHDYLYIERSEDAAVRHALEERVGTECVLISLIGARQTGKTSLLNRLHAQFNSENSDWITIKVDLSMLAEAEGEAWYQQFIAACCERLQQRGIALSVSELQAHNLPLFIPPFSARGWTELLRLACQRLSGRQCLLVSLDEISSVPRQQWEPFFSNLRAIHQAASSSDDRPEYRRLGLVMAGAFVPTQLINIVEKSPFNVSTKVYMSPVGVDQLQPLTQLLVAEGFTVDETAVEAIYSWSGGLLYHAQRFCAEIAHTGGSPVTSSIIDALANKIAFDDAYLSHILRRLQETEILARHAQRIMQKPLRSDRNDNIIATLEITGVIRHDPATNVWEIANRLCEQLLHQHFSAEEQTMTGLEPIAAVALTKAVDFLFDEASKLMEERRAARKTRGDADDTPPVQDNAGATKKEEVLAIQPKTVYLKDIPKEVEHCIKMIHQYRNNKRSLDDTIAAYGGYRFAPLNIQNQLRDSEDEIKNWSQQLKNLVEESYGHKIVIVGLN